MRILCDLDDVLWDLVPRWTRWLYMEHGIRVEPEDVKTWDIQDYYPTLTREQVFAPLFHPHFFVNMEPVPGAVDAVRKLKADGHEFVVVTATHHKTAGPKIDELLRLFPMLTENDIVITGHKNWVDGTVLIDDSVRNVESFPWFSILLARPHNADHKFSRPQNQFRCDSWDDICERISEIDKRMKEVMLQ